MTLKQRIYEDMKVAMKAKESLTLSTIRLINAEIKRVEVDERVEVDDARVVQIITKMVKQRKDSVNIYTEAGRTDLAEKEQAEIDILNRYLPKMMSTQEIESAVEQVVQEVGALGMADMGKVMNALREKLVGVADMGQVSVLVKSRLGRK